MPEHDGRHPQEEYFRECLEGHDGWGMAVWRDGYAEVIGPEGLTYNSVVEFDWYLIQDHATDDKGIVNEEDVERIRLDAVEGSTILDCVEMKMRSQNFNS